MQARLQSRAFDGNHRHRRTRRPAAALLLSAALMFISAGRAMAVPGDIHLLSEEYTTDLTVKAIDTPTSIQATRKTVSEHPVSDELTAIERVTAKAEASTFLVSTNTVASPPGEITYPFANAVAQTVLNFKPLDDAPLPFAFDFAGSGLAAQYSTGFVTLLDLTTDQTVFSYSWTYGLRGNVPWDFTNTPNWPLTASLEPAPELLASHEYALTMNASTSANNDGQYVKIELSGVNPVPEADILSMMLLGVGFAAGVSRLRRGRSSARCPGPGCGSAAA